MALSGFGVGLVVVGVVVVYVTKSAHAYVYVYADKGLYATTNPECLGHLNTLCGCVYAFSYD